MTQEISQELNNFQKCLYCKTFLVMLINDNLTASIIVCSLYSVQLKKKDN